MNEEQLKCAAMGIITYMNLLDANEPIAYETGEIMEVSAELDDKVFEATMELLSGMDMEGLEMFRISDGEDGE